MIFTESGRIPNGLAFYYRNTKLDIVKSYCYLGIDFVCSGSFKLARDNLIDKAQKAMFPLKALVNQFQLPVKKSLRLFHSLIRSIILYNAENLCHLSHRQLSDLDENRTSMAECLINSHVNTTHQKFLKYLLGVRTNCCNIATMGELGEYPLLLRAWTSSLSFWHRSSQMKDDTLVKKALNYCMANDHDQQEWLSTIKSIMGKLNLNRYFENPSEISTNSFKQICTDKLEKRFQQEWQILLNNQTGTLRFYKTVKQEFEKEKYLDNITCYQLRKIVTKFRCSDHRLEIQRGRQGRVRIDPENRICQICRENVENETHFLAECPLYITLRSKYLGNNVDIRIPQVLQPDDKENAYNLANFLTKALELREVMLRMRDYFI